MSETNQNPSVYGGSINENSATNGPRVTTHHLEGYTITEGHYEATDGSLKCDCTITDAQGKFVRRYAKLDDARGYGPLALDFRTVEALPQAVAPRFVLAAFASAAVGLSWPPSEGQTQNRYERHRTNACGDAAARHNFGCRHFLHRRAGRFGRGARGAA